MDIVRLVLRFEMEEQVGIFAVVIDYKGGVCADDNLCHFCLPNLQDIGTGRCALKVRSRIEGFDFRGLGAFIHTIR